ncbi:MAG TPA: 6-pyruvoyl-tetrahydropterin synthase-related protein [Acidimicrobiia bacterium]
MSLVAERARSAPGVTTPDPGSPERALRPWSPWWAPVRELDRWIGPFVLAACVAFVFWELRPDLLFRDTTPTGGDTAAHVWWPAYLRDHLLPWRIAGWSPDFYAGFPAGQFYFPVPALLILAFDVVFPYNIAFKLGTITGPLLLPVSAYVLGRGLRAPRPAPALLAVAATAYLFFTGDPGTGTAAQSIAFNQHIAGGSLPSMLAGEYSYTLALAFALAFFGTFASALRTGRRMWLPALLLAAAVMSHLVVAIFAVVGAFFVWLASRPKQTIVRAAVIGGVGTLLTAVWLVPLLAVLQYTTDMRYTPITEYTDYLFPDYLFGVQSAWPWQWGATVLIGIALIGGIVGRRTSTFVVIAITAVSGLLFRFWEDIQATTAWNLRFLPFWYLGVFLLLGLGGAEVVRGAAWAARRAAHEWGTRTPPRVLGTAVAVGLTAVLSVGALISIDDGKSFLPFWTRWNYLGYEDTKGEGTTPAKQYGEYRAFVDALAALPPGRVLWEGNTQLNVYGSPLAPMLLPYWTHGRIASMEGVYYEASATSPYHFMATAALDAPGNSSGAVRGITYRSQQDFDLGVRWLQVLGIRYLAVHSAQAKAKADADPRLRLVTTSPDFDQQPPNGWSVYEVRGTELVAPLRYRPVVIDGFRAHDQRVCRARLVQTGLDAKSLHLHEWQDCIGVPWFDDPRALDRPLVDEGPAAWQRAGTASARGVAKQRLPEVRISKIHSGDDEISFHVSRTGVPVVVRESWFPNWEADGAEGPYRATPNFMVVVPTRHDVTLHYGTTSAEWLGRLATLAGIVGVGLLAWWPIRARRRREAEAEAGTEEVDPAPG